MKRKIFYLSIFLILIFLTGCKKNEYTNEKTFKLNFKSTIFSAYKNSEEIKTTVHEENTLLFEPIKDGEASFISVKAKTESSTNEECMEILKNYKEELKEKGNKITVINETMTDNVSFLTYSLLSENGNITTIYSKCSSNESYTLLSVFYNCYSKDNKVNNELKNTFDSIILNKIETQIEENKKELK